MSRRLPSRRRARLAAWKPAPSVSEIFRRNPYRIDGRSLFYAPSIGTDPGFADIIIEQAIGRKKLKILLALSLFCARLLSRE